MLQMRELSRAYRTDTIETTALDAIDQEVIPGEFVALMGPTCCGVIELLGISHSARHRPSQLSGGQQQRVAVARALVAEPKLILADEPTGNLDTTHGEEVMGMLRTLNAAGSTIVMVTHSPAHADYAGRVVNMLDGRILQERRRAA